MADLPARIRQAAETLPIGSVLDSIADLEMLSYGKWLRCDSRYINAALVDARLASQFVLGKPTTTQRTMAAVPSTGCTIDASPNYFVSAATATNPILQYSSDGATWSQATISTATGAAPVCVRWCDTRWVSTNGSGAQCTSGENPAVTWTTITGPPGISSENSIAYSPTLALTIIMPGSGTSVYSVPDGSTTGTSRTVTTGSHRSICWTGERFLMREDTPGRMQVSTNGTSWSIELNPFTSDSAAYSAMVSDGAGTVAAFVPGNGGAIAIAVSKDHGASWRMVNLPRDFMYTFGLTEAAVNGYLRYHPQQKVWTCMNTGANSVAVSKDALNWIVIYPKHEGGITTTSASGLIGISAKGGTYVCTNATTTDAFSFTMDGNKLKLPGGIRTYSSAGYTNSQQGNLYIKVRE